MFKCEQATTVMNVSR